MNKPIDYKAISISLNEFANEMMLKVREQYGDYLSNMGDIPLKDFVVVDEPTTEDIAFFSKQNGKDFDVENVPSAHGGRTKGDGKVHVYPYSPDSFGNCQSTEEIIEKCKSDVIIHEIFHYFIRPKIEYSEGSLEAEFAHFITEGLVDGYASAFAESNNLAQPNSDYNKNILYAHRLLCGMPDGIDKTNMIFNATFSQIMSLSQTGGELLAEYKEHTNFVTKLNTLIEQSASKVGYNNKTISRFKRYYANINDKQQIISDLSDKIQTMLGEDPAAQLFIDELESLDNTSREETSENVQEYTESGPKLVRTMPTENNNTGNAPSAGSDGKINYFLIIVVSLLLFILALIGIYIISTIK